MIKKVLTKKKKTVNIIYVSKANKKVLHNKKSSKRTKKLLTK